MEEKITAWAVGDEDENIKCLCDTCNCGECYDCDEWQCDLFSHIQDDVGYPYVTIGHMWVHCIPYEGNEYLLGTTKSC